MTSVTTFACLQKFALGDASPALNCQLHALRVRMAAELSVQGEDWKILSLGIGLGNTTLLAGMDTKSIPVEWNRLTVLKSILPW